MVLPSRRRKSGPQNKGATLAQPAGQKKEWSSFSMSVADPFQKHGLRARLGVVRCSAFVFVLKSSVFDLSGEAESDSSGSES